MILREFEELIEKYPMQMEVFVEDTDRKQIICNFEFHPSIIHPSMFWTSGLYSDSKQRTDYGLTVKHIISRIASAKQYNSKFIKGYKGQEEDSPEPEDRHILISGNMKSVYCGKYKYVTPIDVETIDGKLIITCKGE